MAHQDRPKLIALMAYGEEVMRMIDAMQELKEMPIWVIHRLKKNPDGKTDKVPFAVSGNATESDEKYHDTWATFEDATRAKEKYGQDTGISFKIPSGYFFLDIDVRDATEPYVQLRLERFGSNAERSVSGSGIHIYGKCDIEKLPHYTDEKGRQRLDRKFYTKHPTADMELYYGDLTTALPFIQAMWLWISRLKTAQTLCSSRWIRICGGNQESDLPKVRKQKGNSLISSVIFANKRTARNLPVSTTKVCGVTSILWTS